ncbi:MAG: response regulator [Chloroflexi bacterium]|nr:response regulator [Chloroflexota bacterium]MYF22310.1 response regulator [Chloroflexota bacterium]
MEAQDQRDLRLRVAELERRLARMGEASLRISEASLGISASEDFDAVLREVVDSARALTGARYGAMTVRREIGRMSDLIVSGLTSIERQGLLEMAGGPAFFEYLSTLEEPLRLSDVDGYMRELGMPDFQPPVPAASLLVAPIRHQGDAVGTVYLAHDEQEREFTPEDEALLVMFASQAAMVIANARRHRQEQQTRADLETLVDTSPVGVVVLDAGSGLPKSFNREVSRIVDRLRDPDESAEELLGRVIFRRADGREFSMQEFSLTELLGIGETVRAEEIVLSVDDGRRVTALLNATPIVSDGGAVESVVVTMQDMAAVEELERLRAEFLAMVSHELRAPLTSITGSATIALDAAADMDPAMVRQFFRIIREQADQMNSLVSDLLDAARLESGELPVNPEPAELAVLVDRARSAFTNAGGGNPLQIDIEPQLPLVMADRRRIVQVLGNLLNNAARNSPEGSVIRVSALREDVHVAVFVSDRGRGIPAESLPNLFRKFSSAQSEDQGGDTGLGLAICKGIVEAHGGRIWAESDGAGLGARFTFTLPTVEAAGLVAPQRSPLLEEDEPSANQQERVRILAVDDDPQALRYVRDALAADGFEPILTGDPQEALQLLAEQRPELILLDLVLPETDGLDLMGEMLRIRDVPVIFLSAYRRDELIAQAFEQGAIDYMVKPFSTTELTARVKSALRRREVSEPPPPYVSGDLRIDYEDHRVTLAGEQVHLTPKEYRMLAELSANAGRLVTYERLMDRVWNAGSGADRRPMRTMMGKLRRKLGEDVEQPRYIFNEPRVGFRMPQSDPADDGEEAPAQEVADLE